MGSNRYLMKTDMAALWIWLVLQMGQVKPRGEPRAEDEGSSQSSVFAQILVAGGQCSSGTCFQASCP